MVDAHLTGQIDRVGLCESHQPTSARERFGRADLLDRQEAEQRVVDDPLAEEVLAPSGDRSRVDQIDRAVGQQVRPSTWSGTAPMPICNVEPSSMIAAT